MVNCPFLFAESESVKEELLKKLRDKTGVTYHALEKDLRNVNKDAVKTEISLPKERFAETASGTDKQKKAIRFILAAKLFGAPYAKDFDLKELTVTNEEHKVVVEYVLLREEKGERIRPSELFEILEEDCAELGEILDLNYGDKLSGEVAERFFKDSVKTLKKERVEAEIAAYNAAYVQETSEEKRKEIARKLSESIQKRNALKKS